MYEFELVKNRRRGSEIVTGIKVLLCALPLIGGCTKNSPLEPQIPDPNQNNAETFWPSPKPPIDREFNRYVVRAGDELSVKFYNTPELNEEVEVLPDGTISLTLIGTVEVVNKSPDDISKDLEERYRFELSDPRIAVIVRNVRDYRIFVGGEVQNPQVVDFTPDMTAVEAIYSAGGYLQSANQEQLVVIRKDENRKPIAHLVSMKDYLNEQTAPMFLNPLDIVFVPKSHIAKVNDYLDQYFWQIIRFRGVGFTFGYDLDESF